MRLDVLGITKKGLPCKIKLVDTDDGYCHYHKWQSPSYKPVPKIKSNNKRTGFIYMYTYLHLYDSFFSKSVRKNNLNWLYVDKSIVSTKDRDQKRQLWNDREHILCKIGMTTKPMVSTRLLEWQNTCKNPVVNLTPDRVEHLVRTQEKDKRSISTLLEKLSTRKKKENPMDERFSLRTYKDGGFFVDSSRNLNLSDIENKIHKYLWDQYGKGFIYCYGCDPMGQKRHTEWFHLPISDLTRIMKTIDYFCYRYDTANT